jgi:4-hydroxy-4-methyl-2-oxoglutarate aldolase
MGKEHAPSVHVRVHVGGVMTIPLEVASEVPDACDELADAEAVVLTYLRAGGVTVKGFAEARNECKRRIDALAKRLKRR